MITRAFILYRFSLTLATSLICAIAVVLSILAVASILYGSKLYSMIMVWASIISTLAYIIYMSKKSIDGIDENIFSDIDQKILPWAKTIIMTLILNIVGGLLTSYLCKWLG